MQFGAAMDRQSAQSMGEWASESCDQARINSQHICENCEQLNDL